MLGRTFRVEMPQKINQMTTVYIPFRAIWRDAGSTAPQISWAACIRHSVLHTPSRGKSLFWSTKCWAVQKTSNASFCLLGVDVLFSWFVSKNSRKMRTWEKMNRLSDLSHRKLIGIDCEASTSTTRLWSFHCGSQLVERSWPIARLKLDRSGNFLVALYVSSR